MTERTHDHPPPTPEHPGKVVIAGGSGLLGRHLTAALVQAGHQVVVLSRSPGRGAAAGARVVGWQADAPGPWQAELEGAQAVVNLCGAGIGDARWTAARKRQLMDSRVAPSTALAAACAALSTPPPVLLQASGVGYYGTGEDAVDEDSPPGHDFLARLAIAWEAPLATAHTRTVALRFGVVLDASDGALPRMLLPFRMFAGGPVAGGRQWLSWVHVDDAVAAMRFVLRTPLAGAINVTAPNPVRNAEFAAAAGRALRRPARLPLPGFVLRAALGEQATLVCDGQRALPARLLAAGFSFRYPTIDAALESVCR
ncbi:MAG: TIGR01777 family oxidoreductase [Pseudomonadales bacterium]